MCSMSKGQAASQLRKLGLKRGKGGTGGNAAARGSDSGVRTVAGIMLGRSPLTCS